MSDLLAIGASGIKAYGRALSIVGDNIANAQTSGYVRRDVRLEEAPSGGDIVLSRNSIRPGGALAAGVDRAVDQWLAEDARTAGGEAARQSAKAEWFAAAERATDDADGVGDNATAIFTTADRLSADPNSSTLRREFLLAVEHTAGAFRRSAVLLASAAAVVATEARTTAAQFNADLSSLSRVNDGLRRARPGSSNEATLLDERDRLVNGLSTSTDVMVSFDANKAAIIRTAAGDVLLDGLAVAAISVSVAANGELGFSLSSGGAFQPGSGRLAGLADAASHIAGQRATLDTLAGQFVSDLNARHNAGLDANGSPGIALLTLANGASDIAMLAVEPGQVAAASAASSNGNALAFANLRGAHGVEAGWADMVAAQAQATAAARSQEAAANARRDGSFAARDAIGSVDLDREAAELLRFQQAYEAAARTIQVARETMQTMLNIF